MAEQELSKKELDILGEISNISIGTSATALNMMVQRPVWITTPRAKVVSRESLIKEYADPCVFVQIEYTVGLDGSNILILNEHDVKVITDLMMFGDGTNIQMELNDMHLSAVSEAMNQMMGSAVTSLSNMFYRTIDISPPKTVLLNVEGNQSNATDMLSPLGDELVKVDLRIQIGDLVDSTMVQIYPIDFAREICKLPLVVKDSPKNK